MDSLTQIVLGAAVGEATLGKKVGNKTVLWGGIIATIPDLDVIPTIWMDSVSQISFHRGFSHSLAFFLLASPLFGWLLYRLYKDKEANWRDWTVFSFWVLFTHALLDCFTSWGTQLFWPLEHRVAWNTIFVVDPLYTIPFMIAVIWMMFYNRHSTWRRRINYAGLIISSTYLLGTVVNKQIINNTFEEAMEIQDIQYIRYSTKPAPLNNILWFATVETNDGYYLGYYSLLDKDKDIIFHFLEKKHELLEGFSKNEQLKKLLAITKGYYTVERMNDTLLLHDLRFGQAIDPESKKGEYIFTFFIEPSGNSDTDLQITQKPRNVNDITSEMFAMLWNRMLGLKNGW